MSLYSIIHENETGSAYVYRCVALIALCIITSCSTAPGGSEFLAYRDAFEESRNSSDTMFELLQNAERKQRRIVADSTPGGEFNPNAPYLYTELADPPLTHEYRLSFDAISRYNEIMVGLVTGDNVRALTADISKLGSGIVGLSSAVTGTTTLGSISALQPILKLVSETTLTAQNRAVFTRELAKRSTPVIKLMTEMRNGSVTIFKFLRTSPGNKKGDVEKLVADWVVLMDRNIAALREAQSAALNPTFKTSDILALQTQISEIREAAKSVRKNIAKLAE